MCVRLRVAPGSGALWESGGSLDAWGGRQVLDGLYPFGIDSGSVDTGSALRAFTVVDLSAGLLDALSVKPAWGREFSPDEYRPGSGVVLASAELWRQLQEAGHATLGATVLVEGVRQTIVGVMPDGFEFPVARVGLWRPYLPQPTDTGINALGTLKRGVTLGQAASAARVASQAHTSGSVRSVVISPFVSVDARTSMALYVLLGAVAMLLLTAIANTANVLMAEAVRRDVELALRATLGASWWRIARQLAVEALVLSTLAALVALLLCTWTLGVVVKSVPHLISSQPCRPIVASDWRALTCAAAVAAVAGLGATSFAILRVRRIDVNVALRGQTSGMPSHGRLSRVLTTTQMATTLALLACAGVLARGLFDLGRSDPGFDPDHVVGMKVHPNSAFVADDDFATLQGDARRCAQGRGTTSGGRGRHSSERHAAVARQSAARRSRRRRSRGALERPIGLAGRVDEAFFHTIRPPFQWVTCVETQRSRRHPAARRSSTGACWTAVVAHRRCA